VTPDGQATGESSREPSSGVPAAERRTGYRASWASLAVFGAAAIGVIQFYQPAHSLETRPFAEIARASIPFVTPTANAFGKSGEVKVRFALPGEAVDYPIEVRGDRSAISYQWVRVGDHAGADSARPFAGDDVVAPPKPGFYQLAIVAGTERQVVDGPTLAVLVPFSQKVGTMLNGYKIGTYVAERLGVDDAGRPAGFVEVAEDDVDFPITKHLRLADFITHDNQKVWPRYTAVSPRLLDKLELVIAELSSARGDSAQVALTVNVHSGFRSPYYNRRVPGAARDSRHQYGDAADVAIDANGDGRITHADTRLVVRAVEAVEADHPELVGGLGLYRQPYVHIDARGTRKRWRG
jgi:uncharacterized protein YcbK (DUF882 family)